MADNEISEVYDFAATIPELVVSEGEPFMELLEFRNAALGKDSVCLVARSPLSGRVAGFVMARIADADAPDFKSACIVYIAVNDHCRRYRVGQRLLRECALTLATRGVGRLYCWADEHSGVIEFMERQGLVKGKRCVWMEGNVLTVASGDDK